MPQSSLAQDSARIHNGKHTKVDRYKWADTTVPGTLQMLHKSVLNVDHSYQRNGRDAKATRIASKFHWGHFAALVVSRRADGTYWVIDGQNRKLAADKRADVTMLPCVVFEGMSHVDEASAFLGSNVDRQPVNSLEKFRARLIVGEEPALFVQQLVQQSGRVISKGDVHCVACLEYLASSTREELLRVWPVILELSAGTRISERLVEGLVYIESRLPPGTSLSDRKWRRRLAKLGANQLVERANLNVKVNGTGGAKIWAEGMLGALNSGLQKHRLELEDVSSAELRRRARAKSSN